MKIKLATKAAPNAADVLGQHAHAFYNTPGRRVVGVVELARQEIVAPDPESETEASVTVRVVSLEIGRDEQEHHLRQALAALNRHRTLRGTLDESGEVEFNERTIELTGGVLDAVEAARLKTVIAHWCEYARSASRKSRPTLSELQSELRAVGDALAAAIYGPQQQELD